VCATFIYDRVTLPFRTDFFLAGVHCHLSTDSHHVLQSALPWQSALPPVQPHSFQMKIMERESAIIVPSSRFHFRGCGHLVFAILGSKGFFTFDLFRKNAIGLLSPAATRDPHFLNTQLLPITIGLLGTMIGVAPLHCACLDRGGSGILLVGESGAGKSTLTAALAKRGFGVISDDWTYVRSEQARLVAYGMFAPVKLLPDAARFFPELRKAIPQKTMNGELAHEVNPALTFRTRLQSHSHPQWVFKLERTITPGCSFIPCSSELLVDFFEKSGERLPEELPEASRARSDVIQLLTACDCWIIRTGEDPNRTAEAIDHFLLEAKRVIT
jgi:hypothetical protein